MFNYSLAEQHNLQYSHSVAASYVVSIPRIFTHVKNIVIHTPLLARCIPICSEVVVCKYSLALRVGMIRNEALRVLNQGFGESNCKVSLTPAWSYGDWQEYRCPRWYLCAPWRVGSISTRTHLLESHLSPKSRIRDAAFWLLAY